jgi:hypothetical protein
VPPYTISIESPLAIAKPKGIVSVTGAALLVKIRIWPTSSASRVYVDPETVDTG